MTSGQARWSTLVALALPFVAVAIAPRLAVGQLASAAASPLLRAAAEIEEALPEPPSPPEPLPPSPEAAEIAALDGEEEEAEAPSTSDAAPPARKPRGPLGVMVSRGRVEAAAKAGIRPSGGSVGATDWRPSGLALAGVGAVGVGLRDGDVVTRVGGMRATSTGAVVSAVTSALRQKLPAITAEVWRGRQRIVVTVELPEVHFDDDEDSSTDQRTSSTDKMKSAGG